MIIRKKILILSVGQTKELDDTTLSAENQYSIKILFYFFIIMEAIVLYLLMVKRYQFKAKDSEIKIYPFCLGNISPDFSANNLKKNRIKWMCLRFFP